MKHKLVATILATVTLMTQVNVASAQVPTPLQNRDFGGPWSVVTNTQGQLCVADRHNRPIDFNSTWCSNYIGVEAVKHWKEQTGVRSVTKSRQVPRTVYIHNGNHRWSHHRSDHVFPHPQTHIVYDTIYYTEDEPVYTSFSKRYNIQAIQFGAGKYVYSGGEVSPELKAFLSSRPAEKIGVQLITQEGETWNYEIGKNTVKGWKKIYSSPNMLPEFH